jgi:hypothetical protein
MLTRREFAGGASCALFGIGEFVASQAFALGAAPGLSSGNNAILTSNNCNSLQNLEVALEVTRDLVTLASNGFSLQVNCYPQTNPQSTHQGKALNWIQYVIAVQNNQILWGIQYWSTVKGLGFSPPGNYSSFASASANQVPAGSVMKIALQTNPSNGNVTSATFRITDPVGKHSPNTYTFPSNALAAIYGFQVDLVGTPSGTHTCTFVSGAGLLTYSVSTGTLVLQTGNNICGGPQILTGETSNAVYGPVTPASGSTVRQSLPILELFYGPGGPGSVFTRWRGPSGSWSAQQNLGGSTNSKITAVVIPGTATVQLFYVGKDGSVWTRWRKSDGSWSEQKNLGGSAIDHLNITAHLVPGTATVQLFYVGKDGSVRTLWRESDGTWSEHHNLEGSTGSCITAHEVPGTDTLQLFYTGKKDGRVWTRWRESDGTWSEQKDLGGAAISNITAITIPGTEIMQLFYVGTDSSIWTRWRDNGVWSEPNKLGGTTTGNIAAIVLPGTQIVQLFYPGGDGSVWTRWRNTNATWSDQKNLGGTAGANITATVVPGTLVVQLFYVGKDGSVWTHWRNANGSWSDRQKLWEAAGADVSVAGTVTATITP